MAKTDWKGGNPPQIGWYNASAVKDRTCWRWWDGESWSGPAYPEYNQQELHNAINEKVTNKKILWNTYWPEKGLFNLRNRDEANKVNS